MWYPLLSAKTLRERQRDKGVCVCACVRAFVHAHFPSCTIWKRIYAHTVVCISAIIQLGLKFTCYFCMDHILIQSIPGFQFFLECYFFSISYMYPFSDFFLCPLVYLMSHIHMYSRSNFSIPLSTCTLQFGVLSSFCSSVRRFSFRSSFIGQVPQTWNHVCCSCLYSL